MRGRRRGYSLSCTKEDKASSVHRLPPFFKAFDRANRGSVRETHFLRVLSTAGLLGELSSRECAALTQYYVRPDQLGESSRPPPSQIDSADIAYTAFLRDLGSSNPKQPGDTQTYGKRLKQTASTKTLPRDKAGVLFCTLCEEKETRVFFFFETF